MNISIKPELENFLAEKLKSGQYANASDLVNDAIEALKEQEEFTPEHEVYLRREVNKGLVQLDSRQYADFDATRIIAEERARLTQGGTDK